jgi:hypothetical protein
MPNQDIQSCRAGRAHAVFIRKIPSVHTIDLSGENQVSGQIKVPVTEFKTENKNP